MTQMGDSEGLTHPTGAAEQLKAGFASFDTTAFLAAQHKNREEKDSPNPEIQNHGIAVARLLEASKAQYPSSSEGEEETEEEGVLLEPGSGKDARGKYHELDAKHAKHTVHGHRPDELKGRRKEKRRERSKKRKPSTRLDSEREQQIAAEWAAGAASRRSSIKPTEPRLSRHSILGDHDEEVTHYYQDVRGDVGNLAFGTLYQGDIARYRRHDPSGFAARLLSLQTAETSKEERGKRIRDREPPNKGRSGKTALWKRPLKSLTSRQPTSVQHGHPSPAFLPLCVHVTSPEESNVETLGEGMDDIMLRTRQFNARTRENPHDLQLWLDFAAFQQEVGRAKGGRYSARSIAEKQVSILEQALQYHPTSPQLVLALLKAAESICDEDEMEQRWLQALSHLPREFTMWDAYLVRRRSNFAEYRALGVAEAHSNALKVFSGERPSVSEKDVVHCAFLAISHLMNTGHTELAIAAIRVLLEMNYFSPEGWPEEALQSMFEEFWKSGAAMLGEPGSCGWSAWLDGSFTNATGTATQGGGVNHMPSGEDAGHINRATSAGVWNVMVTPDNGEHDAHLVEDEGGSEGESKEWVEGEGQWYADELDKQVDAALAEAEEYMPPEKMCMWLAMEHKKDGDQWLAVREESKSEACDFEEYECVKWQEVSSFALVINDTEARVFLLRGCLHFLGLQYFINGGLTVFNECLAPFEDWKLALPIIMDEEHLVSGQCVGQDFGPMSVWETSSAQVWARMCPQRKECVINCILMLLKMESEAAIDASFLRTLYLARSLIKVAWFSGLDAGEPKLSGPSLDQARALMKSLLAQFKDSTALWFAFAEMEGFQAGGSRKVASKILTSLLSPPTCHTGELATIVLCLARLELGTLCEDVDAAPLSLKCLRKASRETVVRAATPLAWLGQVCNGGSKVGVSSFQLSFKNNENNNMRHADMVAARRGYQDQLTRLSRESDPGLQKAYVSCAAAFELVSCLLVEDAGTQDTRSMQLSNGVNAALYLYDQFLKATLAKGEVECTNRKSVALLHLEHCNLAIQTVFLTDMCPNSKYASPQAVRELLLSDWLQHCFLGSVSLLCRLELGGHNISGLRRELNLLLCRKDSFIQPYRVNLWCHLISLEIKTQSPRSAVRAVFDRAASDEDGRRCSTLWRAFLKFESRHNQSATALFQIFLRAIESCPWSKRLWLDGISILNGVCSGKELTKLIRVMREKELAVRTDVLEVVLADLEKRQQNEYIIG